MQWIGDGWPDCMDGSDESGLMGTDGTSAAIVVQCVQCAGVILPAAHLCSMNGMGVTPECINDMIGEGECNVCTTQYL